MIDIPAAVAIIGGLVAALTGIGAFLRSGADRDNVIVDSAETVVTMLTTQVQALDGRLSAVEGTVMAWESWAERVLQLLDRTITMLDDAHRLEIATEATHIRQGRPTRTGVPRPVALKPKPAD